MRILSRTGTILALSVAAYLFLSPRLTAHPRPVSLAGEKFRVEIPKGWQEIEGLFGMPYFLLGPRRDGARPVLSVTPTGIHNARFDEKALGKSEATYREGRERWLKKRGGTALEYFPYRKESWSGGIEVHGIGFRYRLGGIVFAEMSYYLVCKSRLFHLKTLLRESQLVAYEKVARQAVESFSCEP
jgi:hypothetical protein